MVRAFLLALRVYLEKLIHHTETLYFSNEEIAIKPYNIIRKKGSVAYENRTINIRTISKDVPRRENRPSDNDSGSAQFSKSNNRSNKELLEGTRERTIHQQVFDETDGDVIYGPKLANARGLEDTDNGNNNDPKFSRIRNDSVQASKGRAKYMQKRVLNAKSLTDFAYKKGK